MATSPGQFPLTSVADLPNVTVAFPGEVWTNRYASGTVYPGDAVVPTASAGKLYMRTAQAGDTAKNTAGQVGIAFNVVQEPDTNTGPGADGPNEKANAPMTTGDRIRVYYSGAFHLTRVVPGTYNPSDLIGWDANGTNPTGKDGVGAWAADSAADLDSIFEVLESRSVGSANEVILTVRSLKGSQF